MKIPIKIIHCLHVVFLMLPLAANSTEEKSAMQSLVKTPATITHDPMSSNYLVQLVVGLFVVLICIVALAWFAKKVNRFRFSTDESLKIIGGLSMGARERVVLLQVGDEQLLLGVSPGQINTLHVLTTPVDTTGNHADKTLGKSFADKLKTITAEASTAKFKQQAARKNGQSNNKKNQ